jgi:ABC-type nitrate/sulfonate/bicarbonate transport system permease component
MTRTELGTEALGSAAETPSPAEPPVRTRLRRVSWSSLGIKIATGLAILVIWQVGADLFAPDFVARPSRVAAEFPAVVTDGGFWSASWSTLWAVVQGLLIAIALGVPVGLLMGRIKVVDWLLRLYVNGFYAMPMIAITPLVIVWFGHSDVTRLVLVIFAAFFPMALNAADGGRSVPTQHLEVARSFGAGPARILFGVALPASLPYLIAGFRLAAGRALVAAVVAEFLASIQDSLGWWILLNARSFRLDQAMVGVVELALFGVATIYLMDLLTRRFLPWYRRG